MLVKLLKYDLKWLNKMLLSLYLILIGLSFFTKILMLLADKYIIFNVLSKISFILLIIACFGTIFYTFFIIIKRYTKNLFKDESYLTHTLPVSRTSLLNSKIISSIIFTVISAIVVIICLLIIFYSKEHIELIKQFMQMNFTDNITYSLIFIIMAILAFFNYILYLLLAFAGIALGYSKSSQKNLYSVIACVILYFITQIINTIILAITTLLNKNLANLLENNSVNDNFIITIMIMLAIEFVIYIVGFYIIAKRTLTLKLNID